MSAGLLYVVGPSGAGKDSVLQALRVAWPAHWPNAHWARRCITRPAAAGGEAHESLSVSAFEQLRQTGGLAMHWQANGLHYGVRRSELAPLQAGQRVWVNGSRAHLPTALQHWPGLTVVHITASADVLRQRLQARGREDAAAIERRLARAVAQDWPVNTLHISNDGTLDAAVQRLCAALVQRFDVG